tara:strand:+ start:611 stop:943 length:333 start_codon:yes stop_codon:yes gene_type:complete
MSSRLEYEECIGSYNFDSDTNTNILLDNNSDSDDVYLSESSHDSDNDCILSNKITHVNKKYSNKEKKRNIKNKEKLKSNIKKKILQKRTVKKKIIKNNLKKKYKLNTKNL